MSSMPKYTRDDVAPDEQETKHTCTRAHAQAHRQNNTRRLPLLLHGSHRPLPSLPSRAQTLLYRRRPRPKTHPFSTEALEVALYTPAASTQANSTQQRDPCSRGRGEVEEAGAEEERSRSWSSSRRRSRSSSRRKTQREKKKQRQKQEQKKM